MKKILVFLCSALLIAGAASAQQKHSVKVKHTSTVPQKVHNVIHHKHKRYSGHKVKAKHTHHK